MLWLPKGEIQADALGDLATKNNTLSVWQIEDDNSNLERVVTALASNRDSISNLDYTVFDISLLLNLEIKVDTNPGNTPYEAANVLHRDLVELTVTKLVKLAETISISSRIERIPAKKILSLLNEAVTNGQIDKTKLSPDISKKLN